MEVFEKDGHRVIYGDAIDYLNSMPDESVNLIFCDPPYNIGKNFNGRKDKWISDEAYLSWCYQWLELCFKKLKSDGSIYIMGATQNMPYLDIFLRKLHICSKYKGETLSPPVKNYKQRQSETINSLPLFENA